MNESQKQRLVIAQEYAKNRNGLCLSNEYIDDKTKMEWKCHNPNHSSWFTTYRTAVKNNGWCNVCYQDTRRLSNGLELAQQLAQQYNGQCLSTSYTSSKVKLEWKCYNPNHPSWFAPYNRISGMGKKGKESWCPLCANEKKKLQNGLELAKKHAVSKNGLCLSTNYLNSHEKMEWKCDNLNHPSWFSTYSDVVGGGHWCIKCGHEKSIGTIPNPEGLITAIKKAKEKNGFCLSTEYISSGSKMEWKCHVASHKSWFTTYGQVVYKDQWCPQCNMRNFQETKVRNILNYLFNTEFIKTQTLEWNINPKTGRKLELDGYSKELNIAFEFQGGHHFEEVYGNNKNDLDYIRYKDSIKKENCYKNNTKLIIINELNKKTKKSFANFFNKILEAINIADINTPKYNKEEIEKIFNKPIISNHHIEQYQIALQHAISKNGLCLSINYVNSHEKMEWKCHNPNHPSWFARFSSTVGEDRWCKKCANELNGDKKRLVDGLDQAHIYAKKKNGQCLSSQYQNIRINMNWKCENPTHPIWQDTFESIVMKKRWCPLCKVNHLEKAKSIAISKGGICLSPDSLKATEYREWKCHNPAHSSWFAPYHRINWGNWCPQCNLKK